MIKWINKKNKKKPKIIMEYDTSKNILILDKGIVKVGCYHKNTNKFEYWEGSHCNLDDKNSQKIITHWAEINYPD